MALLRLILANDIDVDSFPIILQTEGFQETELNNGDGADQYMRACLMLRNENHRLAEWVAYHYTTLPLKHLIVATDEKSVEDPMDVMGRWNGTDLKFQVWRLDDFGKSITYTQPNDPVYRHLERQAHFVSRCLQYFHRQGDLGWVALTDSDEYITPNPLDDKLNQRFFVNNQLKDVRLANLTSYQVGLFLGINETWRDRILARKKLRVQLGSERADVVSAHGNVMPTALDVLVEYTKHHDGLPCHAMSRLRYSVVKDNFTALASSICNPILDNDITASINVSQLTTIQYLYHVKPESYILNDWSKVLVDLRRIPYKSLYRVKYYRNTHAPLDECSRPPLLPSMASLLRVNHYLHDFHAYTNRIGDPRRNLKKRDWLEAAKAREGPTCHHMHGWLNVFVEKFGMNRAKYLLLNNEQ
jgi:hypothetical protein